MSIKIKSFEMLKHSTGYFTKFPVSRILNQITYTTDCIIWIQILNLNHVTWEGTYKWLCCVIEHQNYQLIISSLRLRDQYHPGPSDIHISLTNSLWTVRRWRTQESLKENVRLQIEHLNGLSPVCVFQCLNDYCDGGLNQDVKKGQFNMKPILA